MSDLDLLEMVRDHNKKVLLDAKASGEQRQKTRPKWPIESDSLACHPAQVAERNAFIKGHGLAGVEARPDGTMVFSGPRERQKYLNKIGLIDRSGYT